MWEKTMFTSEDGRFRPWESTYFTEIKIFLLKLKVKVNKNNSIKLINNNKNKIN